MPCFNDMAKKRSAKPSSSSYVSYSEKLRDPKWQKMRLQIMERDKFTCCHCQDTEKTLNVHHLTYTKGAAPWEYEQSNLITLCEDCHELAEERITMVRTMAGGKSPYLMRSLCRILHAQAAMEPFRDPGLFHATDAFFSFLDTYKELKDGTGDAAANVASLRSDFCTIANGFTTAITSIAGEL